MNDRGLTPILIVFIIVAGFALGGGALWYVKIADKTIPKQELVQTQTPSFNKSKNFDQSVKVFMSITPSNILAVFEPYGPHKAELELVGTSETNPSFTVTAKVSYDSAKEKNWVVKDIGYNNIPSNYGNPLILSDSVGFNGLDSLKYVAVQAGKAGEKYVMTWKITGEATLQIRPVLLPRFESAPWIGDKKGFFIKIRNKDNYNPGDDPYISEEYVQSTIRDVTSAINRMSNSKVNMHGTVKEVLYKIPQSFLSAECSAFQERDLYKNILRELGYTETNYKQNYDWLFWTMYQDTARQLKCDIFRINHGGGVSPSDECINCGPGGKVSATKDFSEWGSAWGFLHELGHGLGLSEGYYSIITGCEDGGNIIKPNHIFTPCKSKELAGPFYMTMSNGPMLWYDPIEREHMGWLEPLQVTLVTKSGVYDLYSENDDLTSDLGKPLILQIPVDAQGIINYVYVITFNEAFIDSIPNIDEEVKKYTSNSIRLSASNLPDLKIGGDIGMAGKSQISASNLPALKIGGGISITGKSQNFYSFNNKLRSEIRLFEKRAKDGTRYHTIPIGEQVQLQWQNTDIKIKLLEKIGNHAKVEVIYNK